MKILLILNTLLVCLFTGLANYIQNSTLIAYSNLMIVLLVPAFMYPFIIKLKSK